MKALRWFTYAGLIFNLGATMSAVLSLLYIATLYLRALQLAYHFPESMPHGLLHGKKYDLDKWIPIMAEDAARYDIVGAFGVAEEWMGHAFNASASFAFGMICMFIQMGIWIWSTETTGIAGALVIPFLITLAYPVSAFTRRMSWIPFRLGKPAMVVNEATINLAIARANDTVLGHT
jgi:hypothetical protein